MSADRNNFSSCTAGGFHRIERDRVDTHRAGRDSRPVPSDIHQYVNESSVSLAKDRLDGGAPGEVLHVIAAFHQLSWDTRDWADYAEAEGFTLRAEEARDRAENYAASASALCEIWGWADGASPAALNQQPEAAE